MKSVNIRKVGSVITGTALFGAALSAPVLGGMDSTGVTKGFFYDQSFNPIAQIVVGEKSMVSDAIVAGNIAATIGNLAYITKTKGPGGVSYAPKGQVVITTAARGAVGDYVQDRDIDEDSTDFYDPDAGLRFEGLKTYEKGDFTSYTLSCEGQTRSEADLLQEGSYNNVHCLFCHNLCMESLKNPSHEMKEKITLDSSKIYYYESGLQEDGSESLRMAIGKNAISYKVDTDYIPLKRISRDAKKSGCKGEDCYIDFEYRGKMILFGEEYYVKDVDGDRMYLTKGKVLDDVTSEGFTAEYNGYRFKLDHLLYSTEYTVAGIVVNVYKPDGTMAQVKISKMANGVVDDLEISGVYATEANYLQTASIMVYDLGSQVVLEDGKDLRIGGKINKDWKVSFEKVNTCNDDAECDISEYDEMDAGMKGALLKSVSITYNHDLDGDEALEKDESLNFPNNFRLTFRGYLNGDFGQVQCSGEGNGGIKLERGEPHQLLLSLTATDGNRYNGVRLDEGPYKKNSLFILKGEVYKYESYDMDKKSSGDADDAVEITLDPQIRGTRIKVKDLQRFCDPQDKGDPHNLTYTGRSCADYGKIKLRKMALVDAMNDDNSLKYKNDKDLEIDAENLFIKADALSGKTAKLDLLFDDRDKSIFFAEDFYDFNSGNITDAKIEITENMAGVFDDFQEDGYVLRMKVLKENGSDVNGDGDSDDTHIVFSVAAGEVFADMSDRNYESLDRYYSTSLIYADANQNKVTALADDQDTVLILPEGGDRFTLKWGAHNRLDGVDICHPQEHAYPTYFIGTREEESVYESILTKEDVGREVRAACCAFTVSKFDVTAEEEAGEAATTAVVNPVLGSLVVPEFLADTGRNLILVGGPAVNGLTQSVLTREEIRESPDKYVVRKSGNMIVVAGWNAGDTVAAGNELIEWLRENIHS